ncbi:hypothetical protein DXG01_014390 [Tephrocybe rancida]|nr:hypothetical protein DXG01_014390 [Tephrocybe rancida]
MTTSLRSFTTHPTNYATEFDNHLAQKRLSDASWAEPRDLYRRLRIINEATPIGSLPPELLCQIFQLASHLESTGSKRPWSHPDRRRAFRTTVSQVSGHWRDVALETPLLWTDIDISPPWSFSGICLALSRAKTCPLSINLTVPGIAFGNLLTPCIVNSSASILCDIIAPHIRRCRKLVIKGDFGQLEPLFIAIMKTIHRSDTPLLKQLVIHPRGVRHLATEAEAHSFVHGVPVLTHLRVTSAMVPSLPPLGNLISLHLTAGDRRALDQAGFATISSSCPQLETLAIYDDAIDGPWPPEATFSFPALRSLQIYGSFMSVSELLRTVQAPLLAALVIAPFAANDLTEYRGHETFSPSKFSALRSLTLSPMRPSGVALLGEAAECFPTVELVMIPNLHSESFRDVFTGPNMDLMWPDLKAVALRNVDCASMERLLAVMACREAAGRPLETLYLDHHSIERVASMAARLPRGLNVLEYDIWSMLHNGDLQDASTHFVGNDFDFV